MRMELCGHERSILALHAKGCVGVAQFSCDCAKCLLRQHATSFLCKGRVSKPAWSMSGCLHICANLVVPLSCDPTLRLNDALWCMVRTLCRLTACGRGRLEHMHEPRPRIHWHRPSMECSMTRAQWWVLCDKYVHPGAPFARQVPRHRSLPGWNLQGPRPAHSRHVTARRQLASSCHLKLAICPRVCRWHCVTRPARSAAYINTFRPWRGGQR